MPKKGYTSITLSDEIYNIALEDGNLEHRNVPNYIKHLILQERHFKEKTSHIKEEERLGYR